MLCPFRRNPDGSFNTCYEEDCMAYMGYDKNLVEYQSLEGDVYEDRLGDPDIEKLCKLIEDRKNTISGGFCV